MNKKLLAAIFLFLIFSFDKSFSQKVSGGRTFAFSIHSDSTLWAWGENTWGNLGNNTNTPSKVPIQVHGENNVGFLKSVVAVAGNEFSAIALKADGTVWAWGSNHYGELGDNTSTQRKTPVQVHGPGNVGFLTGIIAIAGMGHHFIALRNDSTVWAWGNNGYGQLGINSTVGGLNGVGSMLPVQVMGPGGVGFLTGIVAIDGAFAHNIALKADGTVWTWGENGNFEIGDGTQIQRWTPVQVHGPGNVGFLTDVIAVTAGNDNCLALKSDSTVWSWGYNLTGGCGIGSTLWHIKTPEQVHGPGNVGYLTGVTAIFASLTNNFAAKPDGTIWAFGNNSRGQIGDSTNIMRTVPTQIHGVNNVGFLTDLVDISGGLFFIIAKNKDGCVFTWGNNAEGELGDGTLIDKWVPVQIEGNCVTSISANITPQNIYCSAACSGAAIANIASGTSPYTYLWSNGATTQIITGLCAGTYSVTVADAVNNTTTATGIVSASSNLQTGTISALRDTICSGTPGILTVTGNSGDIQWMSSITAGDLTPISGATSSTYTGVFTQNTSFAVQISSGTCTDTSSAFNLVVKPSPIAEFVSSGSGLQKIFNSSGTTGDVTIYEWNFGDGATSSEANPVHTFGSSDTFHVCLSVYNGSNCSFTICKDVDVITGIMTVTEANSFIIYPNPFRDYISIDGATLNDEIMSIDIYDLLGRKVFSQPFQNTGGKNVIDLSALSNGMYCIKINADKADYRKRLIKQ